MSNPRQAFADIQKDGSPNNFTIVKVVEIGKDVQQEQVGFGWENFVNVFAAAETEILFGAFRAMADDGLGQPRAKIVLINWIGGRVCHFAFLDISYFAFPDINLISAHQRRELLSFWLNKKLLTFTTTPVSELMLTMSTNSTLKMLPRLFLDLLLPTSQSSTISETNKSKSLIFK